MIVTYAVTNSYDKALVNILLSSLISSSWFKLLIAFFKTNTRSLWSLKFSFLSRQNSRILLLTLLRLVASETTALETLKPSLEYLFGLSA